MSVDRAEVEALEKRRIEVYGNYSVLMDFIERGLMKRSLATAKQLIDYRKELNKISDKKLELTGLR